MNRLKYIVYLLLLTQLLSAGTLATPKITKIKSNWPYSSTASIIFKGSYAKDTSFKIFNNGKGIRNIDSRGYAKNGAISFFTDKNTNYSIQIQAVKGSSKSKLSKTVLFSSTLKFKFTVGKDKTIILGNPLTLDAKITKGDKDKIDFYRWEENGKVLKNAEGDDIRYWDEENSENDYIPKKEGVHFLNFIVTDTDGEEYSRSLRVEVIKATALPANALTLDMRGVKRNADKSYSMTMKLGDFVRLSGRLSGRASKYKELVDFYHWEKDGKILKNMVNDDIQYWDESNRENDYKPTKAGVEHLKFVVTDVYGEKVNLKLSLTIKGADLDDDHGNSREDATKIVLNKTVTGEKNYGNDHDFFSFTLGKKQYVKVNINYGSKSKRATLYTSELKSIKSHRSVPGSDLYRPISLLLEAGTYYVDVSLYSGKYTLKIETDDIAPADEHGDTMGTATKVSLNSTINSHINTTKDIDYFYVSSVESGFLTYVVEGGPILAWGSNGGGNSYTRKGKIRLRPGKKHFFFISLGFGFEGQIPYKVSLSFEKN